MARLYIVRSQLNSSILKGLLGIGSLQFSHILQEKETVISPKPPSGIAADGAYYSTQNLTHKFFEPEAEAC